MSQSNLRRTEFDSRLSLGGKGQIDNQRGLLNKTDLVLPDFLQSGASSSRHTEELIDCNLNENQDDISDGLFDDGKGIIPTGDEAENMFRTGSTSSLFSNTKSTSSLFQDITNQINQPPNQYNLKDEPGDEGMKKRSSLTKADLIDLPSPPKIKRMSPPKTSVV
jgi:hypothetical protein